MHNPFLETPRARAGFQDDTARRSKGWVQDGKKQLRIPGE
jgi:hypothetical protein